MTAPQGQGLPVGAARAQIFALNSFGVPAASATTVYEGLQIIGPKAFTYNDPADRTITHTTANGVDDVDSLAPQEAPSGELSSSRYNMAVIAALTGASVVTIGESKQIGKNSSKRGFEPYVGLFLIQQTKNQDGAREWLSYVLPKAKCIPRTQGMQAQESNQVFQILPSKVSKNLWGTAFALATDGFTRAFHKEVITQYYPWLVAWQGDNTVTKFTFHTDRPAVSTSKINGVWVYDASAGTCAIDATPTLAVDGVTPTTKPDTGDIVICLYEIANPEEG